MARRKPAHYRGDFHVRSRRVREAAKADWTTRCWRCHKLPHEHPPHKNGKQGWWEAGHVIPGDRRSPLVAEWSTCNRSHGASHGNALRGARRRAQKAVRAVQEHTSTRW